MTNQGVPGLMDFDDDQIFDEIVIRLRSARTCNAETLDELRGFLQELDEFAAEVDEDAISEVFDDSEDDLSFALNDSDWRSDQIGPQATRCAELLDLVYTHLAKFNENIEVILATNPFISQELAETLSKSNFRWEEDGTAQALARNTSDSQILRQLADSQNNSTRYAVAANPNTPSDLLAKMASDVDISDSLWISGKSLESFIQVAIANNPSTPLTTLNGFTQGEFDFSLQDFENAHGFQLIQEQDLADLRRVLAEIAHRRLSETA